MCGRFTFTITWAEVEEMLSGLIEGLEVVGDGVREQPARYNISPTQPIVVIHQNVDPPREMRAGLMRWGYVPVWVKDPREFSLIINARSESIQEKPSFRGALRHHRCLIPASGYYEWRRAPDGSKQPFYITAGDDAPLMMAGVYSTWLGASGEEIDTVAIITTSANEDVKHIHDRMPVIIAPDDVQAWLDVKNVSEHEAEQLLANAPPGFVKSHPVSKAVGSGRMDGPDLVREISLEDIQEEKPRPKKKSPPAQGELF